jgi:hypothetical protein
MIVAPLIVRLNRLDSSGSRRVIQVLGSRGRRRQARLLSTKVISHSAMEPEYVELMPREPKKKLQFQIISHTIGTNHAIIASVEFIPAEDDFPE